MCLTRATTPRTQAQPCHSCAAGEKRGGEGRGGERRGGEGCVGIWLVEPEQFVKKANNVENGDGAWLAAAARAENVEGKMLPLPHQRPMVSTGRGVRKLGIMHAAHCIACKEKMQVLMRVTGVQATAGRRVWVQSTGCDGGGGGGGTDVLCNGS
jgi:hypothetical protein